VIAKYRIVRVTALRPEAATTESIVSLGYSSKESNAFSLTMRMHERTGGKANPQ
jgi:hypothetical protein